MSKKNLSGGSARLKGILLIAGSVAVGGASGLGLDHALPKRGGDVLSAHAEESAPAEEAREGGTSEATVAAAEPAIPASNAEAEVAVEPTAAAEEPVASEPEAVGAAEEPVPVESPVGSAVAEAPAEVAAQAAPVAVPQSEAAPAERKVEAPRRAVRPPAPPAADVLRSWWTTAGGAFSVKFVGQVAGQTSLGILFSQEISDASALARSVRLIDEDGKTLSGEWRPGKNARLAIHPDLRPGRYTVVIGPEVASATGQQLQAALRGPIYIR